MPLLRFFPPVVFERLCGGFFKHYKKKVVHALAGKTESSSISKELSAARKRMV